MPADFPVLKRLRRDADLLRHLALQQPEIEPAIPNVVANRHQLGRIGRIWRYRGGERQTAKK